MAPIVVNSLGWPKQTIDDPELRLFLDRLNVLGHKRNVVSASENSLHEASAVIPAYIDTLTKELQRFPQWRFQEQADLYGWIAPLDLIDAALTDIIQSHPHMLLVEPPPQSTKWCKLSSSRDAVAQSLQHVQSVSPNVIQSTTVILQFLASFLRNSINKVVFNSVGEISALLAAADDTIADLALQVLSSLSLPPLLSRQHTQDVNQHSSALHLATSQVGVHSRLMELTRGWGTKGTDLGLADCVFADDSVHGQGSLPQYPGQFSYEFYSVSTSNDGSTAAGGQIITVQLSDMELCRSTLLMDDIGPGVRDQHMDDSKQVEKRRRMGSHGFDCEHGRRASRDTKSTAELFFMAIDKAGGRTVIPHDRIFPLLAQLRLAKSFYSQAERTTAVERRLFALIAVLNGHPSHDTLLGYFHAQPELCTELIDLIKPIISSSSVASTIPTNLSTPNDSVTTMANTSLLALADSRNIPVRIRTLAVECLTALVARRETNHGGALSGLAKLTNVFNELGIGKTQFLGFLPTLVRFTLASLNTFLMFSDKIDAQSCDTNESNSDDDIGLQLGQIFLQASKGKTQHQQSLIEEQSLEFVDAVLTLTSAVVSVSSGTASLTECGLIPALLNTITLESTRSEERGIHSPYIESTLKFIVAQAVQVLEVAVAMHSNALAVFYDLNGVEILVCRISAEVDKARHRSIDDNHGRDEDVEMKDASSICEAKAQPCRRKLKASKRSLLFSLFNCLTVVFHQQEQTPASNSPRSTGSHHLKDTAVVRSIVDIVENVDSYGGVLAALTCTLVSDIINADPPVMHFVISSGIADAILFMITGRRESPSSDVIEPKLCPSSELMLAVSTLLSTFSITSDGEEKLLEHNPFRELMEIFIRPAYSMPESRCLLSDIASIVGTTFEDIIRNHSSFRPIIVAEVTACLKRLVLMGNKLVNEEKSSLESTDLDKSRTFFIQHAYHLSQIVEQLLSSNDETLKQFELSGGFDQILSLYPTLLPHGRRFLAHISTHSSTSLAVLSQHQTIASFSATIESCSVAAVNEKLISKILLYSEMTLDLLQSDLISLRLLTNSSRFVTMPELAIALEPYTSLDVTGSLENVPLKPVHLLNDNLVDNAMVQNLASFLRQILIVEWLTDCLATKMKSNRRWTLDSLLYGRFKEVFCRLSMLHRTSIFELCRVRTQATYEERESNRWTKSVDNSNHPSLYRLRIVCPEGAIVRDGVDIDSSLHIGALEMGEIIEAYDRCINSSGVMRYRTANGWVSEQTRGNGRELIAEVFHVGGSTNFIASSSGVPSPNRTECGIPDIVLASGYILARLQSSYSNLCSSLSRITQGMNSGSSSMDVSILHMLTENISISFRYFRFGANALPDDHSESFIKEDGLAMYLGYMITLLNTCLFEDRRDRAQTLNILLLSRLLFSDGFRWGMTIAGDEQLQMSEIGFFSALRFILKVGLQEHSQSACGKDSCETVSNDDSTKMKRRITRSVAASFPVAISTCLKLVTKCALAEISSWSSAIKKLTDKQMRDVFLPNKSMIATITFDAQSFAKGITDLLAEILSEFFGNVLFRGIPAHMLHPSLTLAKNMLGCLEEYSTTNPDTANVTRPSDDNVRRRLSALSSFFSDSARTFQPSEAAIDRLVEMGFSREVSREAIENCRSNNLEVATEWALTHLPSLSIFSSNSGDAQTEILPRPFAEADATSTTFGTVQNLGDSQIQIPPTRVLNSSGSLAVYDSLNEDSEKKSETKSEPNLLDRITTLKAGIIKAAVDAIEGQLTNSSDFSAVNGVACSFLLDFCDRYPSKRSEIVIEVMCRLTSVLKYDEKGSGCQIVDGKDCTFASLCHAAVLLLRALPSTRPLALRYNIVNSVTQCIRNYLSKLRVENSSTNPCPLWLSPALLFLEILSQPVSVELEDDEAATADSLTKRRSEYIKVCHDHRKQRVLFSKYIKRLFMGTNDKMIGSAKKKRVKQKNDKNIEKDDMAETDSLNEVTENDSTHLQFPMFLPLMTTDSAEVCAVICVHLLRGMQRNGSEDNVHKSVISSEVVHAALLLLTSVSRSHKISSLLHNMGVAELLLSLPPECRFEGLSGLLTVAFCRLLEDETTLQAAMEVEIKNTMIKLQKKQNAGSSNNASVSSSAFIQAVIPLIHRDQMVFLKSVFASIKFESSPSVENSSPSQYGVVLLTIEERNFRMKLAVESSKQISHDTNLPASSQAKGLESLSPPRAKLPAPSSCTLKNQRKDKTSSVDPMGHISTILLTNVIMKLEHRSHSFLNLNECIDVIADLVLSIPGFSTTLYKYSPPNTKQELARTVARSLTSSSIVHHLLHKLLPVVNDSGISNLEFSTKKKKDSSPEQLISQSSARLLVSLVARPGEGRWFVISELATALFDDGPENKIQVEDANLVDGFMYSYKAWGDLCLSILSLRSAGSNQDKETNSLNFDIAGMMYEAGVPHGILRVLNNMSLTHPLAAHVAAALLRPLEVLSRPPVIGALKELRLADTNKFSRKQATFSSSQVDNVALEDSDRPFSMVADLADSSSDEEHDEEADGEHISNSDENSDEGESSSQIETESADDEDTEEEEEEDDDDEDDDDDDSEDSIENEDIDDVDSFDSDDDDAESSNHVESVDDEEEGVHEDESSESESDEMDFNDNFNENDPVWNEETDEYFDEGDDDDDDDDNDHDDNDMNAESEGNDGWARIENSGFLDFLSGRLPIPRALNRSREMSIPGGEFLEQANEAISMILRDSNLENEARTEIENAWGVRITRMPARLRFDNNGPTTAFFDDNNTRRSSQHYETNENLDRYCRGPTGPYPSVNQRSPPDMGFSSSNISGRLMDVNFAEYLFSTSTHGEASRFYYAPNSVAHTDDRNLSHQGRGLRTRIDDSQITLGGLAQSRSPISLHPLLSTVNLPPSNSLICSDIRLEQGGQMDRDLNLAGILSSNLHGTMIRVHRNLSQGSSRNGLMGIRGWSDETMSPTRILPADFAGLYGRSLGGVASSMNINLPLSENNIRADVLNLTVNDASRPNDDDPAPSMNLCQSNIENQGTENMVHSLAAGLNISCESSSTVGVSIDLTTDHMNADQNIDQAPISLSSIATENLLSDMSSTELLPNPTDIMQTSTSVNFHQPSMQQQTSETLSCPPGIDEEVFRSLPIDMQIEVVGLYREESDVEMNRDNSNITDLSIHHESHSDHNRYAEEMDNASFIASLSPELREEILRTSDDSFLSTLPPAFIAEAQLLRDRATEHLAAIPEGFSLDTSAPPGLTIPLSSVNRTLHESRYSSIPVLEPAVIDSSSSNKRARIGKLLVSTDADSGHLRLTSQEVLQRHGALLSSTHVKGLLRLMYLLSPVRPQRLIQKVFRNICELGDVRRCVATSFIALLNDDVLGTKSSLSQLDIDQMMSMDFNPETSTTDFPPRKLIGTDPRIDEESNDRLFLFRRRQNGDNGTAGAAIATYLPLSARCASSSSIPPVVARRLIGCLHFMIKHIDRFPVDVLHGFNSITIDGRNAILDALFSLLSKKVFYLSSTILEELLNVIDTACSPLDSLAAKEEKEDELNSAEKLLATQDKKIWVDVPRPVISEQSLQLLCSILRLESCKENSLVRVNSIVKRLCKVEENRAFILIELVAVAKHLSVDSERDLKALSIRLDEAVHAHSDLFGAQSAEIDHVPIGTASSAVTLASSSSEVKLLRVLQTLRALFYDPNDENKNDVHCIDELNTLFEGILLDRLWDQLNICLRAVSSLEGIKNFDQGDVLGDNDLESNMHDKKKVRNNVAGLMTRLLPVVEAFFVVHSCLALGLRAEDHTSLRRMDDGKPSTNEIAHESAIGSRRLVEFVSVNKILLNALLRNNQSLLDRGLKIMVLVPQCRNFLEFDVKRLWFKSQIKKLRQQANRRYGSLRLNIRRQNVFEDAYHQLRLRNADEMRGKLHVSFRHEEGVDAGGLSREFFSILAKEIFNPNYALFTSTEDGCTFQPNMHSSINPDHLSYFRFVGRIVGKAILDGYLLDVHFTRSLYKHMLGLKPTYHDMEAIDPDYYRNLQTILDYNLDDIDLDLTFSTETHSFGRSQTIDLMPNGRNVKVNENNKKDYVNLICQHRMTTAIEKQIKAYLDGFHEMIKPDLISIFNARELELLISGMPDIDMSDLKKNTDYDGYKTTDKEIQWFWNILFSLSRSDKAAFVQFVTGSSKVPLGGFSELQGMRGVQKFSIHKVLGSKGALMSAHTCFNSLDLPLYDSEEEMREKLLYAIHEGSEGFLFA